ncbi:hypothetical protein T4E_9772 [Trichinella pseudospiralis]|uniref:Uncharacterized protein n=1 Tax=Trichinella pseudospiralis TaxID=6337 RepID=A0A0V0XVE1_TRIPS|nr:hypothetical protein T4E_9772 [Trichinella pseudospiralis]
MIVVRFVRIGKFVKQQAGMVGSDGKIFLCFFHLSIRLRVVHARQTSSVIANKWTAARLEDRYI